MAQARGEAISMAVRPAGMRRPGNLARTLRALLSYMGHARLQMLAVAVLTSVSALANLAGTYMIKPVVNSLTGGDVSAFATGVVVTAVIYAVGALSCLGYTQTSASCSTSAVTCSPTSSAFRCRSSTERATVTS